MTGVRELLAEHGSPLWLVDVDRVRESFDAFRAAWSDVWPDVEVAYSCKTNRLPAILRALVDAGCGMEVVCEAEYGLARDAARAPGDGIVVGGPVKSSAMLARAAADGALVVADTSAELGRAAAAGVRRVGLRVALRGEGVEPTRFGIAPADVARAARHARALGLEVEVLAAHLASTGFERPLAQASRLGEAVTVGWPPSPARHAAAAARLAELAGALDVPRIDLGGGHPPAPSVVGHARAVTAALRAAGFTGGLLLEPGRALVADAVDLACTVVAVKSIDGDARCAIADAGTNLVPSALWAWPRIEAVNGARGVQAGCGRPVLVTGPLCLDVDVLHPAAQLPDLSPGDPLLIRAVGAYNQSQSTQFGELRPGAVARDGGTWRPCQRGETLEDLLAGDRPAEPAGIGPPACPEEDQS